MKERLARLTQNDRRVESQVIIRELKKILIDASVIAAYHAYADEPDLTLLLTELLEQKNVICMPKAGSHGMTMHSISSLEEMARNPVTNIPEPVDDAPIDEATIDVVLVPGRAFTRDGKRLGRGNGGYDLWISEQRKRNSRTRFIGVCFDCQIVQDIPMEAHDERVDRVIAPTKV